MEDRRAKGKVNSKLVNIVFHGGTFGNFLRFILDKFSKFSPDIDSDPFTDIGTSHKIESIKFSGLIGKYHPYPSFISNNEGAKKLPICIILPSSSKHFLFLKKAQWYRPRDRKIKPDDLWSVPVGEIHDEQKSSIDSIKHLYGLQSMAHFDKLPKFIVRDWYKLEFLTKIEDTFNYQWFDSLKKHKFFNDQKVYHLDLETFFDWNAFMNNLTNLDRFFGLGLDFERSSEMKFLFQKGLGMDIIRQESSLVHDVCENDADADLTGLDVCSEAFIYSEYEKRNPNIQMPLTNRFFRDTEEIRQFLEHFPNWYRRPNPNLPRK